MEKINSLDKMTNLLRSTAYQNWPKMKHKIRMSLPMRVMEFIIKINLFTKTSANNIFYNRNIIIEKTYVMFIILLYDYAIICSVIKLFVNHKV